MFSMTEWYIPKMMLSKGGLNFSHICIILYKNILNDLININEKMFASLTSSQYELC